LNGVAPLVQRRRQLRVPPPIVYALAAGVAGSAIGLMVGYAGSAVGLPPIARRAAAIAVLCGLALREVGWIRLPVPELSLRVPPGAVAGLGWRPAFVWGTVLGLGFLTFIRFGVFWATHGVVFLLGSPLVGGIAGAAYGISRSTPALLVWLRPPLRQIWLEPTPAPVFRQATMMTRIGAAAMMASALVLAMVTWIDGVRQ